MAVVLGRKGGSGGAGGAPSGPAGGGLAGTYPNPTIAALAVDTAQLVDDSVTAAKLDDSDVANINALLGFTWTAYTPTLSASVTPPTLGSGSSVSGRYVAIGKLGVAMARINFGSSGVAAGSGTYRVSLPWTVGANAFTYTSGVAMCYDSDTNDTYTGVVGSVANQAYVEIYVSVSTNSGTFSNNTPVVWAANDQLHVLAVVEIA